jgi:hypothetical protein
MLRRISVAFCAASCFLLGGPALAGRTAIDQLGDTPISASFSGYCDFNGDDCGGRSLPYKVSIGGAAFSDVVAVQGNGILTFGAAFPFFDNGSVNDSIVDQNENGGSGPLLTDYGLTLVSAGQNNTLEKYVFFQSASLDSFSANGVIRANWFTCDRPTAPGVCPQTNPYSLTLTPTQGGFLGHFDLDKGSGGSDRGFVIDGVFTPTENDFFLPALFDGLTVSVPEPATWAMMVTGFGLMGAAMRRRKGRAEMSLG